MSMPSSVTQSIVTFRNSITDKLWRLGGGADAVTDLATFFPSLDTRRSTRSQDDHTFQWSLLNDQASRHLNAARASSLPLGTIMEQDSESDWSEQPSDDESLLDFFSGEPSGMQAQKTGTIDDQGMRSEMYEPLGEGEIRIILLERAIIDTDPVHLRFKRTSIRWPAPYIALSYAWGQVCDDGSHLSHTVLCDGTPLKITKTLHDALLRIRQSESEVVPCYWIDAICINQQDHVERSAQVMIMDKVYSNAKHLLIWLGEQYQLNRLVNVSSVKDTSASPILLSSDTFPHHVQNASWFKRRWVIQEAASCNSGHTILIGNCRYPVTNVVDVRSRATEHLSSSLSPIVSASRQRPLFANLIIYRNAECSDDRDRVYALRNISSDGGHLPIDYSKTADELYMTLTKLWMQAGHTSKVLSVAAQHRVENASFPNPALPSWALNWRVTLTETRDSTVLDGPSLRDLGPNTLDAQIVTMDTERCLRLRGWLLARCRHNGQNGAIATDFSQPLCCRIRQETSVYQDMTWAGGAHITMVDAMLVTEDQLGVGLKTATRSDSSARQHTWSLFGAREKMALLERDEGWYLHAKEGVIRLPERQYVYLV